MLVHNDRFGDLFDRAGDLNADGVSGLIVGHSWDDDGDENKAPASVFFLNADGSVGRHQKISDTAGGVEHNVGGRDLAIPVQGRLEEVVAVGNRVLEKAFVAVAEGLPGESSVAAGPPGAERRHPTAFHSEAPTPSALWERKRG